MERHDVALDDLVLDPNLNLRDRLDDFTVECYAETCDRLPPIVVFEVDGQLLIADGFHRHAAAVMVGKRTLPAEVRTGTMADALDFVSGVNLLHGLPLNRAERRRAVELKLKLHPDWSDRKMADELGVGRELVAKVRRQLVEGGQIPSSSERLGSDGKVYSMGLPRDPNERLPQGPSIAQQDEPQERDRRGMGASVPPWENANHSPSKEGLRAPIAPPPGSMIPPWESFGDAKAVALASPPNVSTPSIDEMLDVMSRQVLEVVEWTRAEGFEEAFHAASSEARRGFHAAVSTLAARSEELG
jgi:hypothetical protein